MTVTVGETYRSPLLGRDITVIAIDKETNDSYTLAILFIDRDSGISEVSDLVVSKQDVQKWTQVAY